MDVNEELIFFCENFNNKKMGGGGGWVRGARGRVWGEEWM